MNRLSECRYGSRSGLMRFVSPVRPVQRDVMFGGEPGLCGVAALAISDGMVNYIGDQPKDGPFAPSAQTPHLRRTAINYGPTPFIATNGQREGMPVPLHTNGVWMGKGAVR
jgi:hypothetical protein